MGLLDAGYGIAEGYLGYLADRGHRRRVVWPSPVGFRGVGEWFVDNVLQFGGRPGRVNIAGSHELGGCRAVG